MLLTHHGHGSAIVQLQMWHIKKRRHGHITKHRCMKYAFKMSQKRKCAKRNERDVAQQVFDCLVYIRVYIYTFPGLRMHGGLRCSRVKEDKAT